MTQEFHRSLAGKALTESARLAFGLRVPAPGGLSLRQLDQWLSEALEIPVAPATSDSPEDRQESWAAEYARRCLALVTTLLQTGNVPVFDPPAIRSLRPAQERAGEWEAQVELCKIDQIPLACYGLSIEVAVNLCRWAAATAITEENRNTLFAALEQKFLKPMKRLAPYGKSTIPVLRVAHRLGIPFIHLGHSIYQLGWGSKARRMDRSTTELDSAMGAKLAHNKVTSANLLRAAGLPAAVHCVAANFEQALAGAQRLGWPLVVKPVDRERGEGVAVDISDEATLKAAFEAAQKLSRSKEVIVERQVAGVCHRLFIAGGKLLYAVKRLPMGVTGDGRHSVAALIEMEVRLQLAKAPWLRSGIRALDQLAIASIRAAGWELASVPPAGTLVPMRRIESTESGGVDEEVTGRVHPDNLSIALMATRLFGLHVAGIDIITPDIGLPWHENAAIINEVNFAPLFGGGEISRRHIPVFLADFLDADARIPVEVFDGGASALQAALDRQQTLIATGARCYFTSDTQTLDAQGKERPFPFQDLAQRVKALLLSSEVDAVVVLR